MSLPGRIRKTLKSLTPSLHQGNYSSRVAAIAAASGYDAANIPKIRRKSMRRVRDGQTVHTRDRVLFDEIEYFFAAMAALADHYDLHHAFKALISALIRTDEAQGRYRGYCLERRTDTVHAV